MPEGSRGEGRWEREKGIMVMEGDFTWVGSTQYNIQMLMYDRIVHLTPD